MIIFYKIKLLKIQIVLKVKQVKIRLYLQNFTH